jgi:hypothetical protein
MYENEHKIILELCKYANYDKTLLQDMFREGADQPYILSQLMAHRLCGPAYSVLYDSGILQELNPTFQCALTSAYKSNIQRAADYRETLNQLAAILKDVNFDYALLKGAYLSSVYPLGLRVSNDIDIMTLSIMEITYLLKYNGFIQGYMRDGIVVPSTRIELLNTRMNRGETVPFFKEVNLPSMKYIEIDINFSLDHQARGQDETVAAMLTQGEPLIETPNGTLKTLLPIHFLIHLCTHLYKEATQMAWVRRRCDIGLYKHIDILVLADNWLNDNFAVQLTNEIMRLELEQPCYYALSQTKDLFGIKNDYLDTVLSVIKPDDIRFTQKIHDPETKQTHTYDVPLLDWVFSNNRMKLLKEVAS